MVFVTFVNELMGSCDQGEAVNVIEFSGYFVAEKPARAARGDVPCFHVYLEEGVRKAMVGGWDG